MTNRKLDTDTHVYFYEQDFYVLSNFSSFRVRWRGIDFDTSEAAYHWAKFTGEDGFDEIVSRRAIQRAILAARSAHDAFKLAQTYVHARRPDWDDVKIEIMRGILRAKANQHPYVRRKLLDTGNRVLVEDSWRDSYWGHGPDGNGFNVLGKLWMDIRTELQDAK